MRKEQKKTQKIQKPGHIESKKQADKYKFNSNDIKCPQ